ncbi:YHS domain-containing protein [Emticicia oligotrophica DSM 17448]|uniref:YHS domain-containing protein n=1 Tax=Emticicia oligotrophica (strain DSM 17448 / CIP 109782 / MTCC 6937 / GPTSA100-15) TaxID=929562 RepID=A0ABM5N5P5_EMTOG|nr:YHS domain-containing (seleno)protein [Emticicia oligotrophica]AFK04686.1 YHS domain-containing protein [Emticicia oligotrophica DSM 17448]
MKNKFSAMVFFFILISSGVFAQEKAIFVKNGIAINGYDAVAYFTESKAVEGKNDFSFEWNEAKWLFSSQANLDVFKTNPTKYAPQYGGFCAYGVSENHKSPTDPNAWTIVDDKLYLNYSKKVKELWSKDIPSRIQKANELWPSLNKSN